MSRAFLGPLAVALLIVTGTSAWQQSSAQTPGAPGNKPAPAADQPPSRPEPIGQPVNVKLDLTITDQLGPGEPSKKIVTMLVADRASGSIRSVGATNVSSNVRINVDAAPVIAPTGAIRLRLGLEYNPRVTESNAVAASLNQQFTVMLDPGKPVVISQSADPVSDRKISVEVRGTVVR